MNICPSHWLQRKNSAFTHKIQKWGNSDLILVLPCNIHLRCPQVLFGTPWPSGLKLICLFRWKPIGFHWKCLLLLWPWQKSNWSGWCMFGSSSIDVSTLMLKIFQTQNMSVCGTFKNCVKIFYDPGDLENKAKVKLMTCNERFCHSAS